MRLCDASFPRLQNGEIVWYDKVLRAGIFKCRDWQFYTSRLLASSVSLSLGLSAEQKGRIVYGIAHPISSRARRSVPLQFQIFQSSPSSVNLPTHTNVGRHDSDHCRPALLCGKRASLLDLVFKAAKTDRQVARYGRRERRFSFIHADDLADVYVRAAEKASIPGGLAIDALGLQSPPTAFFRS